MRKVATRGKHGRWKWQGKRKAASLSRTELQLFAQYEGPGLLTAVAGELGAATAKAFWEMAAVAGASTAGRAGDHLQQPFFTRTSSFPMIWIDSECGVWLCFGRR